MDNIESLFAKYMSRPTRLSLQNLLSNGYFPKELPPSFTSKQFAKAIIDESIDLPLEFTKKKNTYTNFTKYSLARAGDLRRVLSILNPLSYYRLSKVIVDEQDSLFKKAKPSIFSLSHPVIDSRGYRALIPKTPIGERDLLITELRVGKRYCLKTDIAQFYPSIYTHALDWAITGKSKAKADYGGSKAKSRLGYRIDNLVSACQNGQTRGLPIGPDSSLLLSSIMLARIDSAIKKTSSVVGVRYMDDYQLMLDSEEHVEKSLAALENALADYELALNPKKTIIEKLPLPIEDRATSSLSNHGINGRGAYEQRKVIKFFDQAFFNAEKYPEKPVLQYAVGIINNIWDTISAQKITIDFIMQCITVEAGVLAISMPILENFYIKDPASLGKLESVLNMVVEMHALRNHSSEVAWAISAFIKFKISLPSKTVNVISKMNDDVCALLLLYAEDQRLCSIGDPANKRLLKLFDQNLQEAHWLYTYTALEKGWLAPKNSSKLTSDKLYKFLNDNDISFFDETSFKIFNSSNESYYSNDYEAPTELSQPFGGGVVEHREEDGY